MSQSQRCSAGLMQPEWVIQRSWELLAALAQGSPGFDAFLPESHGRRGMEPLCAVYGPGVAPAIERRFASGELETVAFHPDVRVGMMPLERVRRCGDPDILFFNVNSPEDLERAEGLTQRL